MIQIRGLGRLFSHETWLSRQSSPVRVESVLTFCRLLNETSRSSPDSFWMVSCSKDKRMRDGERNAMNQRGKNEPLQLVHASHLFLPDPRLFLLRPHICC